MKRLFFIALAALPLLTSAQVSKNVTVDTVGQLAKQIQKEEMFKISELKVSGPLNSADVKLLQQIVNRSKANEKKGECVVTAVDISEAVFTEGKEAKATGKLPNGLFSGAKQLLKVTLPQGITSISKSCFDGCAALPGIDIPESVTAIENQAFQGCESLAAITIPKNVTAIGDEAFENCKALTSMEIPENVGDLGSQAFNGCSALTSVTINGNSVSSGSNLSEDDEVAISITPAEGQVPTATINGSEIELTEDGGVYTGSFAMPGQASTLIINTGEGEDDDYDPNA